MVIRQQARTPAGWRQLKWDETRRKRGEIINGISRRDFRKISFFIAPTSTEKVNQYHGIILKGSMDRQLPNLIFVNQFRTRSTHPEKTSIMF